jgi:Flp pilus assembly protein TadD
MALRLPLLAIVAAVLCAGPNVAHAVVPDTFELAEEGVDPLLARDLDRIKALTKAGQFREAERELAGKPRGVNADIENLVGFTQRKLGRMDAAKAAYETALRLNPNHRGALEYFGEWHVETGDLAGARALLVRLKAVCAGPCEEVEDLEAAIAGAPKSAR